MASTSSPIVNEPVERRPNFFRRIRLALTCVSIALNAACAGGIFTFPMLSPTLSNRLRLTQPQLTTIVLAGMMGQYPLAAVVGSVIDNIGPWICSLASALFFSVGFSLFSLEIRNTPTSITHSSPASFHRLVFFFLLAGFGTLTSYFSALFCASKNFPRYSGVASGTSMALFGLSPLILSFFASWFFTDSQGNIDGASFTMFLAILTGIVHVIGAVNLNVEPQPIELGASAAPSVEEPSQSSETPLEAHSEATPLLGSKIHTRNYDRAWDVIRDYHFWVLAVIVFFTLGPSEMVITNIGTISSALPTHPITSDNPVGLMSSAAEAPSVATQVRLLSLSNTISRIIGGPMADYISPVASYLPSGLLALPHHHKVSRVAFLWGACVLLAFSFLWMVFGVKSQEGVWAFSIGVGIAYGTAFTVLPSVIASIWGLQNLARNFGIITYAPFLGTPTFSYLYAFIASAATEQKDKEGYSEGVCQGKRCWSLTFCVGATGGLLAASLSVWLWRSWRGRV